MTMNSLKFFLFLLLSVLMFSCGQETSPEEQSPEPAAPTTENPASSSATNPITVTGDPSLIPDQGAAASAGVGSTQHYYCPNKCAGSGGNGGVLLGLNGLCIKSHGGADSLAFSQAVMLAVRLARHGYIQQVIEDINHVAGQETFLNPQAAG